MNNSFSDAITKLMEIFFFAFLLWQVGYWWVFPLAVFVHMLIIAAFKLLTGGLK